jgi:molecular chaperone DnaK
MVKEAESHADEDKKRRELVEIRNQAEALVHSTERMLKDFGDKVGAGDKATVESALNDLKSVVQGEDKDAIKQKIDALAQASMKLGEAMYQASQGAAGAAGGPSAEGGGAGPDDKVVDVDFEEVKDDDSKKSA